MRRWHWPLLLDRIIVDHARRPAQYPMHFIIFLLAVIVFCMAMIIARI
jgi:hypothetical protein